MKVGPASKKTAYGWISILENYHKNVTESAHVLEIGASTLDNTKEFAKWCKRLTGVEYLASRMPKNFDNVTFVKGDWQRLSSVIKPNSIDLAVSNHVIEHVEDDLKAVNELYKVLKPGGVALINTPNRKRLTRHIADIFTGERKFPHAPLEHVREYVEDDIHKLLKKSAFKTYAVNAVSFGLHSGPFYINTKTAPGFLRKYANFWEIHLFKE
jgi:ubiquinone/menaquinone biosynthesis C-methylase UbiE